MIKPQARAEFLGRAHDAARAEPTFKVATKKGWFDGEFVFPEGLAPKTRIVQRVSVASARELTTRGGKGMPSAKEAEEIAAQHEELRTLWEAARKAADGFQKLYLQMEKDTAYPGKRSIGHYRLDLVRG